MRNLVVFGMCVLSAFACKSTDSIESQLMDAEVWTEQPSPQGVFDSNAWNTFLALSEESYEYQPACKPASFRHQGELKGVVVLLHGFTACPQQFFALSEKLSREGWDVLLPTLPGHGVRRNAEEAKYLPQVADYRQRYGGFVKRLNELMRSYEAPQRAIGGVSLGGALATGALAEELDLYDRALIMTPYYRLNPKFADLMGALKNLTDFARMIDPENWGERAQTELRRELGWGEACENEALRGRQGICKFTYSNLIASQQFGYDLSKSQFVKGRLQFVGVDADPAIDNGRLKWFYENRVKKKESTSRLCFYPEGTNHSIASVYDAPDEPKFWLPRFEQDALTFLTKGEFFKTTGETILSYPECSTETPHDNETGGGP